MEIIIRKARPEDREAVKLVERQSTPTLRYLPNVLSEWLKDPYGEFLVAEAAASETNMGAGAKVNRDAIGWVASNSSDATNESATSCGAPGLTTNAGTVDEHRDAVAGDAVAGKRQGVPAQNAIGQVVACGKFTVMPDGSAWLEALRVMPAYQGRGIGKGFYIRFFELARDKGVPVMRMYTGTRNAVSKGLAERNGFHLAATFRSASAATDAVADGVVQAGSSASFKAVHDPKRATEILMPLKDHWGGFFVMNRTFYEVTPELCAAWAAEGKVYEDADTGSVVAAGARFMPETAVHLAAFGGDSAACISFAASLAASKGVEKMECMFPPRASDIENALVARGFKVDGSEFIVMQVEV